jgi:hypothetical protein
MEVEEELVIFSLDLVEIIQGGCISLSRGEVIGAWRDHSHSQVELERMEVNGGVNPKSSDHEGEQYDLPMELSNLYQWCEKDCSRISKDSLLFGKFESGFDPSDVMGGVPSCRCNQRSS